MIELKPCPFCGGEAYYSYIGDGYWIVRCFDCQAEVKYYMGVFGCFDSSGMKQGREEVVNKWNARAET